MVMISSIEEVAQVVLQVHHQHRLRGWTLSAELGDSLLLGGGAAPVLQLMASGMPVWMVCMPLARQTWGSSPSLER